MARRVIRFASIAAILAAALTGCAIGDRAKALYLYQHKLLAALTSTIIAIEPDNPDMADRLYDSEDELNTACQALWDAGNRRVDAREIGDGLKWQVFTTLESCTEKSHEVETLLWSVDPGTAEIYLGDKTHRPRG